MITVQSRYEVIAALRWAIAAHYAGTIRLTSGEMSAILCKIERLRALVPVKRKVAV